MLYAKKKKSREKIKQIALNFVSIQSRYQWSFGYAGEGGGERGKMKKVKSIEQSQ